MGSGDCRNDRADRVKAFATRAAPSQTEFVALMAMLFATVALSIDAMLPALPTIAAELTPDDVNRAQLVVSSLFLGMGIGTLIAGPVSDAIGRKRTLLICAAIYVVGAALCLVAPSLEMLLFARLLQGLGAAGPRSAGMAMVRDLYKGRDMARIMSFVMMIFTLVPAVAPLIGQTILLFGSWRLIFAAFIVFALLVNGWFLWRQTETLAPPARRPLQLVLLWQAMKELTRHRIALISTLCQGLTLGALLASLSSLQSIFGDRFDRADSFPLWFAFIAICAMSGSVINSRVVVRLGMRTVLRGTYATQLGLNLGILALNLSGALSLEAEFALLILWAVGVFGAMGLTMGNLNALAMEDLGHIAGFAASVIAAASTVLSVLLAVPVGLAFNGTEIPLVAGGTVFAALALGLMQLVKKPA